VLWGVDDHLLPDRAPGAVLEVMDLIEDHQADLFESGRLGIDHVSKHLCCHHDDLGVTIDHVVAREQAHPLRSVSGHQVRILLIGEGFDRGGVERPLPTRARQMDRGLRHEGLPRPGGSGDDHRLPVRDRLCRLDLEVIRFERKLGPEGLERVGGSRGPHFLRTRRTSQ